MKQYKALIFQGALLAAAVSAQTTYPPLDVLVDGAETTLYVQYPTHWSAATTSGADLSFDFNNRMYLSTQDTLDTAAYFKPNLVGGSLEFDVDLSQTGCGCITALYAVVMPSPTNTTDEFQYCGANGAGGSYCPEFDMMEANKYAWRSVGHKCDNVGGLYENCEGSGQCQTDVLLDQPAGVFAPGSVTGIDTDSEFHVRQDFHTTNGAFSGYTTTFSQAGREVILSRTDCESYLGQMDADMAQMAIVFSNWGSGGNLNWLQHNQCEGTCSTTSTMANFRNLEFRTANFIDRPPQPAHEDLPVYKFGNVCDGEKDQTECGANCSNCHMSWPADDPDRWLSDEAACRCMPPERAAIGYSWGQNQCNSNTTGLCDGCGDCRWSWPSDDPLRWSSAQAACRCKPSEAELAKEYFFAGACNNLYDGMCEADCHKCIWSWPVDEDHTSSDSGCRCPLAQIRDVEFGGECPNLDDGLCGSYCRECRWSWEATDPAGRDGDTGNCRCRNWWGS